MELKGTEFTIHSKTQKSYLRPCLSQKDIQWKNYVSSFPTFSTIANFWSYLLNFQL